LLVLVTSWACIDPALYSKSFHKLWSQNYHTINKNSHLHLLYNPLLYPAAIVGGTGFPLAVSCLIGLRRCFSAKCGLDRSSLCIILAAPFLLFVIYWSGDATFVRRASAFIPFCALFAGLFIASLRRSSAVAFAIIGYTLLFTAISQYAFIDDTRYQAQRYLNQLRFERDQITVYSKYAKPAVKNSSLAIPMSNASLSSLASYGKVGLVVLHETYYGRYGKSFTTPFRLPKNCDEVYHCKPKEMPIVQAIVSGKTPYMLLKRFDVEHPFPERILFKALFGTYETFLGDVLIFERRDIIVQ